MSLNAFGPRGLTHNIAANTTASAALKIVSSPSGFYTFQFVNSGGNKCYFAWDSVGQVQANVPVPGTPGNGVPVLPNEIVVYSLGPNAFVSVICPVGTTNLEVTVGEGM
jgi:hypothetical protein